MISLTAMLGCSKPTKDDRATPSAAATRRAPSAIEIAGATYSGIEDLGAITLRDGKWEGQPYVEGGASLPTVWLTDGFYLTGDLDGQGDQEAVGHLAFSGGGTGNFGYLAVMGWQARAVVQRGLVALGDRVQIREARIEDNRIVLDVLQAGPSDPLCCPSQLVTRTFAIQGGRLVEASTSSGVTASLATLEDRVWVLRKFSSTEAAPAEPAITLSIKDGRVSGSSGCNRYNGTLTPGETATSMTVGPLAATRMTCPPEVMAIEQRFINALSGAQSWGFLIGQLVVNFQQGDRFGSLFFEGPLPAQQIR